MVTFAISYGGTLETLSTEIYGDQDEADEFLPETFEIIHYLLFLVMVLTICEVLMLVNIGGAATANFTVINLIAQDEPTIREKVRSLDSHPDDTIYEWFMDYLCNPCKAWAKHTARAQLEETVIFYALRKEFIMNRSPLPPYEVAPQEKWLPANFGTYIYLQPLPLTLIPISHTHSLLRFQFSHHRLCGVSVIGLVQIPY